MKSQFLPKKLSRQRVVNCLTVTVIQTMLLIGTIFSYILTASFKDKKIKRESAAYRTKKKKKIYFFIFYSFLRLSSSKRIEPKGGAFEPTEKNYKSKLRKTGLKGLDPSWKILQLELWGCQILVTRACLQAIELHQEVRRTSLLMDA